MWSQSPGHQSGAPGGSAAAAGRAWGVRGVCRPRVRAPAWVLRDGWSLRTRHAHEFGGRQNKGADSKLTCQYEHECFARAVAVKRQRVGQQQVQHLRAYVRWFLMAVVFEREWSRTAPQQQQPWTAGARNVRAAAARLADTGPAQKDTHHAHAPRVCAEVVVVQHHLGRHIVNLRVGDWQWPNVQARLLYQLSAQATPHSPRLTANPTSRPNLTEPNVLCRRVPGAHSAAPP
jgi:hypothetical protein